MKIDWNYIENNLQWIIKLNSGYRFKGNLIECNKFYDYNRDEVKYYDLCAVQPKELEEFISDYESYGEEHGWITIPQFYQIWAKEGI